MTTATKAKGLHGKLAEVMAAITHIEKSGRNEAQRYDYTRQADVAHAVRTELAQRGVTCVPTNIDVVESRDYESKSGGRQHFLLIRIAWTFTDSETAETMVVTSLGAGTDSGDKSPYKAMTGASKYAELLSFLIPTGDDPEKEAPGSERASAAVGETPELLGRIQKAGKLVKGTATQYQGEWRETPNGHAIGFRLKLPDGKDIPQVLITGPIGEALWVATEGQGLDAIGSPVTVKGHLYAIKSPGRSTYYRLVIGDHPDSDFIETDDLRIPAPPTDQEPPAGMEVQPEAPTVPLFSDPEQALIDAAMEQVG